MPMLHSGSNPSPTRQRARHIACTKGLHEIFKYTHLKFTVYGRKHTHNFRQCSSEEGLHYVYVCMHKHTK